MAEHANESCTESTTSYNTDNTDNANDEDDFSVVSKDDSLKRYCKALEAKNQKLIDENQRIVENYHLDRNAVGMMIAMAWEHEKTVIEDNKMLVNHINALQQQFPLLPKYKPREEEDKLCDEISRMNAYIRHIQITHSTLKFAEQPSIEGVSTFDIYGKLFMYIRQMEIQHPSIPRYSSERQQQQCSDEMKKAFEKTIREYIFM